MGNKRIGSQTVKLQTPPSIIATSTTVGPKEGKGPLREYFDVVLQDELWGENTWEKAESKILRETIRRVIEKGNKREEDVHYIIAGDLLNQIVSSTFAIRPLGIPYIGIYGACSNMAESLALGSMVIDGGFADLVVAATSSHFCSAEKQFRYPLELGIQRPLTAQWTVTGSGASLLSNNGEGPYITHVTMGKIIDFGVKDANQMGAAMAPAAADTIINHFRDTGFTANDYDLIITGDLATIGKELAIQFIEKEGYPIRGKFEDCGCIMFDIEKQDVHAGASGCGCSATVLNAYLYNKMMSEELGTILFVSTGALMSTITSQQGESIPGIAHAVRISKKTM